MPKFIDFHESLQLQVYQDNTSNDTLWKIAHTEKNRNLDQTKVAMNRLHSALEQTYFKSGRGARSTTKNVQ